MLPLCHSRSRTCGENTPRIPLVQPRTLPCLLSHRPSCRTLARRRDRTRATLPFCRLQTPASLQNSAPRTLHPFMAPPPPPLTNPCPRTPSLKLREHGRPDITLPCPSRLAFLLIPLRRHHLATSTRARHLQSSPSPGRSSFPSHTWEEEVKVVVNAATLSLYLLHH
jgi:hypothetical protein